MPQASRYDFGVVLLCAVVFLKALYKSNAGLCTAEASSGGLFLSWVPLGSLDAATALGEVD